MDWGKINYLVNYFFKINIGLNKNKLYWLNTFFKINIYFIIFFKMYINFKKVIN